MPVFHYVSVDEDGRKRKGVIDGNSSQHVQQLLQKMHLTPIEIALDKKKGSLTSDVFSKKYKVSAATLSLLTFQFSALLAAGFPVEAALLNLVEQTEQTHLKTILLTVRTRVLEGNPLVYGMNEFPRVFPKIYRATVAAGDKSGHLEEVMTRLATYLEQQEAIRQKIQQAMIYPTLLMIVSFGIILFLLTYAMPKITAVFIESGQALPWLTSTLISLSHGLKSYGLYIALLIIIAVFAARHFLQSDAVLSRVQYYLLKTPVIGSTLTIINAARFSRTFGILFAASVPVSEAMQTANSIITLLPMKAAIKQAIIHVVEGVSIHQALYQTGYFTKLSTQLIASGEASGKLELMLEKTATYQEQQVARWITTTLSLIEPVMILFMGVIVLFIVLAILLPIFQMNEFLS